MNLATTIWLYAGGPGSGCAGPNCGRPSTGVVRNTREFIEPPPNTMSRDQKMDHYVVSPDGEAKRVLSHLGYFMDTKQKVSDFLKNGGIMVTVSGGGPGFTFGSKDESTVDRLVQVLTHPVFSGYEATVSYYGKNRAAPELEFEGRPSKIARQLREWAGQQRAA